MSSLRKGLFASVTGTSIEAILLFIRGIIVVKTLSIDDFGTSIIIVNFFALLGLLLHFRTSDIILKYHHLMLQKRGFSALSPLYFFSMLLPLTVTIAVSLFIFKYSDSIALNLYSDQNIGPLICMYLPAFIFTTINGISSTALRIQGKNTTVVITQVVMALISLILIIYFSWIEQTLTLKKVIIIYCLATVFLSIVLIFFAAQTLQKKYGLFNIAPRLRLLDIDTKELRSIFFGVNITSWMKSSGDIGGLFLLSLLSNNTNVALYGFARQIIRPLGLIQTAIYNITMPEFMKLLSLRATNRAFNMINKYMIFSSLLCIPVFIIFYIYANEIIELFSTSEYMDADQISIILLISSCLSIIFQPFYSVALYFNMITLRNWISCFRFIFIGIAAFFGLTAINLAYANLAGNIAMRTMFDLNAYVKIKKI